MGGGDNISLICICVLFGFGAGVGAATSRPFICGTDICNRGTEDQFCNPYTDICRNCREVRDDCGKPIQPVNCTTFCVGYLLQQKLQTEKERPCTALGFITDGTHNGSSTTQPHGDHVLIKCADGFQLIGSDVTTCGDFGVWTAPLPICQARTCEPLIPTNDEKSARIKVRKEIYFVYDVINFECPQGRDLKGVTEARCTDNGTWNIGSLPTCVSETGSELVFRVLTFVIAGGWLVTFVPLLICFFKQRHKLRNGNYKQVPADEHELKKRNVRPDTENIDIVNEEDGVKNGDKEELLPEVKVDQIRDGGDKENTSLLKADPLMPRRQSLPGDGGTNLSDSGGITEGRGRSNTNPNRLSSEMPSNSFTESNRSDSRKTTTDSGYSLGSNNSREEKKMEINLSVHVNNINNNSAKANVNASAAVDPNIQAEGAAKDDAEEKLPFPTEETGITKEAKQPEDNDKNNDDHTGRQPENDRDGSTSKTVPN